jgi:hypothetical protein
MKVSKWNVDLFDIYGRFIRYAGLLLLIKVVNMDVC